MKKLIAGLMALLMIASGAMALAEGGDALARIQAKGTLTIAMEGNWSP